MIDKYAHLLDIERAVYDTIMLDDAVRLTRDWARARGNDTLILVLADHNHPNSLVGTVNDDMSTTPDVPLRERVGVNQKAGFPMRWGWRRGSTTQGIATTTQNKNGRDRSRPFSSSQNRLTAAARCRAGAAAARRCRRSIAA